MPESEEERKKAAEKGHTGEHAAHAETPEEKRKREEDARKRDEKK
jgi:hypothetical protein